MTTKEYKVDIYSRGLVFMSICTNMPKDEIPKYLGEHEPTGISSPWEVSDENFASGEKNGCDCPDTEGNNHWLVSC